MEPFWAEIPKSGHTSLQLGNTNPSMLRRLGLSFGWSCAAISPVITFLIATSNFGSVLISDPNKTT